MDRNTLIKVVNRNNCSVGYPVPDNVAGLERTFAPGETKEISFEELEKLAWIPGGKYLLENYLVIKDDEAIKLILGDVEPEYYYSEADIKYLLEFGTLDQLMDCLDFGTDGVISLVKDLAVKLEIPDMRKRQAITEKTGFNINMAIVLKQAEREDEEEPITKTDKVRRSAPVEKVDNTPKRRTAAPAADKYKVLN